MIVNGETIMGVVGILIAVIGILVSVFPNPIRDFVLERIGRPIQIKPKQKDLLFSANGDNWNEEFFVYLTNNTNNTYYDVNIISEFPNSVDVDILPENSDEFSAIGSKGGGGFVGADFMLAGENREKGTKVIQTVINNIGPNEKKKIKVVVNKKSYSKNFRLEFKVGDFKKIPKSILNK